MCQFKKYIHIGLHVTNYKQQSHSRGLKGPQSINSPRFMEPEGSLPHPKPLAISSYPESDQSSPFTPIPLLSDLFNNILPPKPWPSKWSLSLKLPLQTPVCTSPLPIHATCPAHLNPFDLITRIVFWITRFYSVQLPPFPHQLLLSTPFSNTLCLCSALTIRSTFHTHIKQRAELYFSIF